MSSSIAPHNSIRVALEPVGNALNSFALLNDVERTSGLNVWVSQTAHALTSEQRHAHKLIFEGLRDALTPQPDEPNFPSYLHNLTELNPFLVRKMVIEPLRSRFSRLVSYATPDTKRLFNDVEAFLYCVKQVQGESVFDEALQREVHALLQDPTALQNFILSHLETMWKTTFTAEWRRVQSSLRWQVEMFTRSLNEEAPLEETFFTFTGRPLPGDIAKEITDASQVVLVPSWHTGRHITLWDGVPFNGRSDWNGKERMLVFFSEPPNYDVEALHSTPVGRSELRARLNALADDTRLRILELLAQQDELSAQDLIATLDLSQSSVSRHLKQLVGMGYLYERRGGEGANKTYRLSSFYIKRTADAINQLVYSDEKEVVAQPSKLPKELRRFLDKSDRITTWPVSKQQDKLLILEYLASFFEAGQVYSEKEINELLLAHSVDIDAAALRRALYEYRFMNRTNSGAEYWLTGTREPEQEHVERIAYTHRKPRGQRHEGE
jgi:uncharacterized membrane protein